MSAAGLILIVDDLEANREVIARFLVLDGYQLIFACDGQEALDAVASDN